MRTNGQSQAFEKPWARAAFPWPSPEENPSLRDGVRDLFTRLRARPQPRREPWERPYAILSGVGWSPEPPSAQAGFGWSGMNAIVGWSRRLTSTHAQPPSSPNSTRGSPSQLTKEVSTTTIHAAKASNRMESSWLASQRPAAHLCARKLKAREEERRLLYWPSQARDLSPVGALAGRSGRSNGSAVASLDGIWPRTALRIIGAGASRRAEERARPSHHCAQPGFRGGGSPQAIELFRAAQGHGASKWPAERAAVHGLYRSDAARASPWRCEEHDAAARYPRYRNVKVQRFAAVLALVRGEGVTVEEETDLAGQPAKIPHTHSGAGTGTRR